MTYSSWYIPTQHASLEKISLHWSQYDGRTVASSYGYHRGRLGLYIYSGSSYNTINVHVVTDG